MSIKDNLTNTKNISIISEENLTEHNNKLNLLLDYANGVTEKADTNIGDAIKTLADGYGKGGGDDNFKSLIDRTLAGNVTIPEGVSNIGNYAFYNCTSLKTIKFPNTLRTISAYAFNNCKSLEAIDIPNSVTTIGNDGVFGNCIKLTSVKLSENLTEIPANMFYGCKMLEDIILPSNISIIRETAFSGCTNMQRVIILRTEGVITLINTNAFNFKANFYVPQTLLDAYKSANKWNTLSSRIFAIESNADILQEARENGYQG